MTSSLIEVISGADFSAAPGRTHKGLTTTIADAVALFELRHSLSKARNNAIPGQPNAQTLGYPAFTASSMSVSRDKGLLLGHRPNSGSKSICVIAKNTADTTGGVNAYLFGSFAGAGAGVTEGAILLSLYGYRWTAYAHVFPTGTVPPLTSGGSINVAMDLSASTAWEMMWIVAEDGVNLRLFHPRTNTSVTVSATGKIFAVDKPAPYRTSVVDETTGYTRNMAELLVVPGRATSDVEMLAEYAAIKAQLAALPTPLVLA